MGKANKAEEEERGREEEEKGKEEVRSACRGVVGVKKKSEREKGKRKTK